MKGPVARRGIGAAASLRLGVVLGVGVGVGLGVGFGLGVVFVGERLRRLEPGR